MNSWILCVFILCFSFAQAKEDPACENLAKESCSQAAVDDGTGIAKPAKAPSLKQMNKIETEARAQVRHHLKKEIAKESLDSQREMIRMFGRKTLTECSTEKDISENCQDQLVEATIQIIEKQVLPGYDLDSEVPRSTEVRNLGLNGELKLFAKFRESPYYKSSLETFRDGLFDRIATPELNQKVSQQMLTDLKKLMKAKIDSLVSDEMQRELLKKKIDSITWDSTQTYCGASLSAKFAPNAYYLNTTHQVSVCAGFLYQSNSKFSLAYALAHEIAHSIDPCSISVPPSNWQSDEIEKFKKVFKGVQPFENIIQCLRSPNSIEAKTKKTFLTFLTQKPEVKCRFDQIGESFSDWMAAEIVPEYISKNHQLTAAQYQSGYSNIFRSICREDQSFNPFIDKILSLFPKSFHSHPEPTERANKILAANPKVRSQMNCSSNVKGVVHCPNSQSGTGPAATSKIETKPGVAK